MKTIEFTDEEANALVQLLDIAVKAAGLSVAQAASVLVAKFGGPSGPPQTVVDEPLFDEEEASIEPPTPEGE